MGLIVAVSTSVLQQQYLSFIFCYFFEVAVAVAVASPGDFVAAPGDFVAAPGDFVAVPGDGVASPGEPVAVPGDEVIIPGVVGAEVTVDVPVPGSSFLAQAPRLKTKAAIINRANNLFITL